MDLLTKRIAENEPQQREGGNSPSAVARSKGSAYDAADAPVDRPRFAPSPVLRAAPLGMKPQRFDKQFAALLDLAARLCADTEAGSLLVMLEGPTD